jgi:hypothetical protein
MNQSRKNKHQEPRARHSDLAMQRPKYPFVTKLPEAKIPPPPQNSLNDADNNGSSMIGTASTPPSPQQ